MLKQPIRSINPAFGCGCGCGGGCSGMGAPPPTSAADWTATPKGTYEWNGSSLEKAPCSSTFKPAVGAVIGALLAGPIAEVVDQGSGGIPAFAKIAIHVVASAAGYGIGRLM